MKKQRREHGTYVQRVAWQLEIPRKSNNTTKNPVIILYISYKILYVNLEISIFIFRGDCLPPACGLELTIILKHLQKSLDRETKDCSWYLGHMIKLTAMLIYGETRIIRAVDLAALNVALGNHSLFKSSLRERLRTHKVFTKDQCFYLNYHKFSIKSYVLVVY